MRFAALRRLAGPSPMESPAGGTVGLAEILAICAPRLVSPSGPHPDPGFQIASIDSLSFSGPGSLTFAGPRTPLRLRTGLSAALVIAEVGTDIPALPGRAAIPVVRVDSIHAAMAALLAALEPRFLREAPFAFGPGNRIAPGAVVEGCLEGDVTVGPGAYVGGGTFIGAGTRIEANAVIQEHCRIGRNCVIQSGAVIGCAGFGFYPARPGAVGGTGEAGGGLAAMPHPAGVDIGDDCWVGANAVVAAGVLNPTALGRGCKLDSHVQIAHNVRLGDDCLLASKSGIAGSTTAGHRLRMGGAASVDGHLILGDDVSIAACSGVTRDCPDKAVLAGFPARPIKEWRRQQIALKRLAEGDPEQGGGEAR